MSRQTPSPASTLPPLFKMAVITGVKVAVKHHLRRGTDVNAADDKGRSALVLATEKGHAEICRILLEAGADPAMRDDDGNDALSIAIKDGRKDVEDILRQYLSPPPPEVVPEPAAVVDVPVLESGGESLPSTAPIAGDVTGDAVLDGDDFDLSLWEEETETPKPVGDASCLSDAEQIQERISRHVPIDTDEDWTDVDIDLPEILIFRRRQSSEEDAAWQIAVRHLILAGVRDGRVTEEQLIKMVLTDEENPDAPDDSHLATLIVVLEDLGIQVDEIPDVFALSPPEPGGEEDREEIGTHDDWIESVADEALVFLSDLLSYTSDPLTQYVRNIGPKKVLSRDEEIDLAREISEGHREAWGAIPRSPAAMAEFLDRLESVERGDASIKSIIDTSGNTGDDATEQEEPEEPADEDENDDEEASDGLKGDTFDIPPASEIPPDIRLKLEAIRTIHDAMVCVRSISEREVFADRLGDALHGLGASSDFMELLWSKVRSDDLSHDAKGILDRGHGRAQAAKKVFATLNLRLVLWLARKYRGLPLLDLVQEGNIGLLKAVDRFDPAYGAKFSTYATWWIRQSITRAIADNRRLIRLPVHMVESVKKVERVLGPLTAQLGRPPTTGEVALAVDLPETSVRRILRVPPEPIPIAAIQGLERPLEESIEDLYAPNPEAVEVQARLKEVLEEVMEYLTEREAEVIRLRFGLDEDNDYTLEKVGQMYGVTRERIRQIEAKALRKLAHPGRSKKLRTFLETAGRTGGGDQ